MLDRNSPEYALMKAAWHERFGGSPKHDHPSEEFESGWEVGSQIRQPPLMLDPQPYRHRAYPDRATHGMFDYTFAPREGFEQDPERYREQALVERDRKRVQRWVRQERRWEERWSRGPQ